MNGCATCSQLDMRRNSDQQSCSLDDFFSSRARPGSLESGKL
jgi:hypothetical protein